MKKKIIIGLLSATLLFTLAGCGNESTGYVSGGTKDKSTSEEQVDIEDEVVVDEDKSEDKIEDKDLTEEKDESKEENEDKKDKEDKDSEEASQTIKVYFSDDQAENLVERELDIELAEGESLEAKVLESLKAKPEDENVFNIVGEEIKFNSVIVEEKIATVDISSKSLEGSSTEEIFLKDGIVAALTSLDSVGGVKFLVDGEEAETLMGHLDVSHVVTKEDIGSNIIK